MATNNGTTRNLETLVKSGFEEAQKRYQGIEAEAQKRFQELEAEVQKLLQGLVTRGQESRKELETLLARLPASELKLLENPRVRELGRKAAEAGTALRKQLDGLQGRLVGAVGVATQAQVQSINQELARLTQKVEQLVGSAGKPANGVEAVAPASKQEQAAPQAQAPQA